MSEGMTVGWKVAALSEKAASVRYRAVLPILALNAAGVSNRIFADPPTNALDKLDALVIVKSFSAVDAALAQAAANRGIPVIFDLCDNIFIEGYGSAEKRAPKALFLGMIDDLSLIVVPTEPLAAVIRSEVGDRVPVHVVPDGIETPELVGAAEQLLRSPRIGRILPHLRAVKRRLDCLRAIRFVDFAKRLMKRLRRFAARSLNWRHWAKIAYRHFDATRQRLRARAGSSPAADRNARGLGEQSAASKRIVWFGNHGAPYARFGIADIVLMKSALETIATELPVELIVVSSNREKYERYIEPLAIPSRFVAWTPLRVYEVLKDADVVVLPNSHDPFSRCKSANRAVLALSRGVPVVATLTSALEPLAGCIEYRDHTNGLRRYLTDDTHARRHVALASSVIRDNYGQAAIARRWREILALACSATPRKVDPSPELIVVLNLCQDYDLAAPIIESALLSGVAIEAWVSMSFAEQAERKCRALRSMPVGVRIISDEQTSWSSVVFPDSVKALLSFAESNLLPHRFARRLTKLANNKGIVTGTLQHGYENVGLTYDDEIHSIRRIDFASRHVFIWGGYGTLHPNVRESTRAKCVPVGCPKPVSVVQAPLAQLLGTDKPVIGIFENLHWHRYDEGYRAFFLKGISDLANLFPETVLLVKPHPAGLWMHSSYEGEALDASNIVVVDPTDEKWSSYTAPNLLDGLAAVITSPSTVALDAARRSLPTAVVANDLQLPVYAPLPRLVELSDWRAFVEESLDADTRQHLAALAANFARRVVKPGDAAQNILDLMLERTQARLGGISA